MTNQMKIVAFAGVVLLACGGLWAEQIFTDPPAPAQGAITTLALAEQPSEHPLVQPLPPQQPQAVIDPPPPAAVEQHQPIGLKPPVWREQIACSCDQAKPVVLSKKARRHRRKIARAPRLTPAPIAQQQFTPAPLPQYVEQTYVQPAPQPVVYRQPVVIQSTPVVYPSPYAYYPYGGYGWGGYVSIGGGWGRGHRFGWRR